MYLGGFAMITAQVKNKLYNIEKNFQNIFWNGYISEEFQLYELSNINSYIQHIYGVFDLSKVEEIWEKKKEFHLHERYLGPQHFINGTIIHDFTYDEKMKCKFRSQVCKIVSHNIENSHLLNYFTQLVECVDTENELKFVMQSIFDDIVYKNNVAFEKIRSKKTNVLTYQFKSLCAVTSFTAEEIDILKKLPYREIFHKIPYKKVILDSDTITCIPNFEDPIIFDQAIQKIMDQYKLTYNLYCYLKVILPAVYYHGSYNTIGKLSPKTYPERTKRFAINLMNSEHDELFLLHQSTLQALLNNIKKFFESYTKKTIINDSKDFYGSGNQSEQSRVQYDQMKKSLNKGGKFEIFLKLLSNYNDEYFKKCSKGDLSHFEKFVLEHNLNVPNDFNPRENISRRIKVLYKINKIFQLLNEQEILKDPTPMFRSYLSDINQLFEISNVQLYDLKSKEEIKEAVMAIFNGYENILFFYTEYTPSILTIQLEQAWQNFKQEVLESSVDKQLEVIYNYLDCQELEPKISARKDISLTEFHQCVLNLNKLIKRLTKIDIDGELEKMQKIDKKYQYCKKKIEGKKEII